MENDCKEKINASLIYFKTLWCPNMKKENRKMHVRKGASYEKHKQEVYWK